MDKKDAYIDKMKAKLKQAKADLDKFTAKAEEKGADAKIGLMDRLEEMNRKRDRIEKDLDSGRDKDDSAWETVREGIEDTWNDLKRSIDDSRDRFSR